MPRPIVDRCRFCKNQKINRKETEIKTKSKGKKSKANLRGDIFQK